ncbi:hypothetical protein [Photorhabdus heterorhabditis]|uniref:hypothetical protein n=1 Tax=Photorhabdus heterorhabditis TaxID=880156 RepID=UPI0015626C3F|nr:hypothetical protein [Photorhabdus heterorhabditis]NRN27944.1 hypothetical protein [Photorhabdus heterorhabditis subsp. aluminescens]
MYIPVIFQVASLLAALTHPGHRVLYDRVIYAPGDSLPCRRDASRNLLGIDSPELKQEENLMNQNTDDNASTEAVLTLKDYVQLIND